MNRLERLKSKAEAMDSMAMSHGGCMHCNGLYIAQDLEIAAKELGDLIPVVEAALNLFDVVKRPSNFGFVMAAAQAFANEWGAYNLREPEQPGETKLSRELDVP